MEGNRCAPVPSARTAAPGHECAVARLEHRAGTLLVAAAHPDDETIGLGATLSSLAAGGWRVQILHVTDGAPRDGALRPRLGTVSRAEAAARRREEVVAALRAGGLDPRAVLASPLEIPDQEAAYVMAPLARRVAERLSAVAADVVITHPYEGGHPDHDAVAFAVHAAVAILERARGEVPCPAAIIEMSSYHATGERLATACFLAGTTACDRRREGRLDDSARLRKRRMLDAFASQTETLAAFGIAAEPLRCAPRYDFTCPPHPGRLYYERLPFGWTGARWRGLASAALRELRIA